MLLRTALPLLLALGSLTACRPMLYPFARAFGSPSEGELKLRRAAFNRLKAQRGAWRIVVYPMLDPTGRRQETFPGCAETAAAILRDRGLAGAAAGEAPPTVPARALGGNQLRYLQDRAAAYGGWMKEARPAADAAVFMEVLVDGSGTISGLHMVVVEASGQVAYTRLFNSHHFGPNPPSGGDAACRLLARVLLRDLERPAEELHPPYGVG